MLMQNRLMRHSRAVSAVMGLVLIILVGIPCLGSTDGEDHHFEMTVASILEQNCLSCHDEATQKGDLILATRDGIDLVIDFQQPSSRLLIKMVSAPNAKIP